MLAGRHLGSGADSLGLVVTAKPFAGYFCTGHFCAGDASAVRYPNACCGRESRVAAGVDD